MAHDLVNQAVAEILYQVSTGVWEPGQALPKENDLASRLGVSRPTMREAVKILTERGVLDVKHGRGTFLRPQSQWTDLETLIKATSTQEMEGQTDKYLMEIRRMIEVGAAGLAATRRTDEDCQNLFRVLQEYDQAEKEKNLELLIDLDLLFHDSILIAAHNPFLGAILRPIAEPLFQARSKTTANPSSRSRAREHHLTIAMAIKAGDSTAAKVAMRAHMTQTATDLELL